MRVVGFFFFSPKIFWLVSKKSLKLAVTAHPSFVLDPSKQTGMKREVFCANETKQKMSVPIS